MSKIIHTAYLSIIAGLLVGSASYVFIDSHQLTEKMSERQAELDAKVTEMNARMAGLQSSLEKSNEGLLELQQGFKKSEGEKVGLKDKVALIEGDLAQVRLLTDKQLKETVALVHDLEDKNKEWIKDSVATLSSLEDDLSSQRKEIDTINGSHIPELEKKLDSAQKENRFLYKQIRTDFMSSLDKKTGSLEKQFKKIQEDVLDVILTKVSLQHSS